MHPRFIKWQKGAPPSENEAEALLREEGYQVFRWTDVPGSKYPKHQHAMEECIWILSGKIVFNIDGTDYSMEPGDRLYLPAKMPHTASVPEAHGTTYLVGQRRS